jgi:cytochrome P450
MLRRIVSPSFRSTSLNEFEPTLKQYCQELIKAIERNAADSGTVDLNEWFNRLSFDVFPRVILTFRFPERFLLDMILEL